MSEFQPTPHWTVDIPQLEDAEAIAYLQAQSWLDTYQIDGEDDRNEEVQRRAHAMLTPERIEKRKAWIETARESDETYYRIVRSDDNRPIGMVFGWKKDDGGQELSAFYVEKKFHATGVAQVLLKDFFDWSNPAKPIELGVLRDNSRAQRFYEKNGFIPIPDSEHGFADSKYLIEMKMVRPAQQGEQE